MLPCELAFAVYLLAPSLSQASLLSGPKPKDAAIVGYGHKNMLKMLLRRRIGLPVTRFLKRRRLGKRSLQCYFSKEATGAVDNDGDNGIDDEALSSGSERENDSAIWSRKGHEVFSHLGSTTSTASSTNLSDVSAQFTASATENSEAPVSTGSYHLSKSYEGETFFDDWELSVPRPCQVLAVTERGILASLMRIQQTAP